jgi:IS4 transposase
MAFDELIERFAREAPVATMVRGLMSNILSAKQLNALFRESARRQYESEVLFSSVVELLGLVVTKAQRSLHAAYQTRREELNVSVKALYEKVASTELSVTRELVRRTAERMGEVLAALEPDRPEHLAGYELRILDGSHLAASEHRLKVTRRVRGGPLPGQALVVLDPRRALVVDLIPTDDGHAQERSLLPELVETLEAGQLWIADRNFCTVLWLHEVALNRSCFIVRHHAGMTVESTGPRQRVGRCETGELFEEPAVVCDAFGNALAVRRVVLMLDERSAGGDRTIVLLTNLPADVAAEVVAQEYRNRWTIEQAFGELTLSLRGEIDSLGYPRAALLGYAIALVTYNLLSVVKGALRAVHGVERVTRDVSFYYLADEVSGTWRGLQIAIPPRAWHRRFASLHAAELADELRAMARHAQLRRYQKHPRGPKKPPPKRRGTSPHVSTARLLKKRQP